MTKFIQRNRDQVYSEESGPKFYSEESGPKFYSDDSGTKFIQRGTNILFRQFVDHNYE